MITELMDPLENLVREFTDSPSLDALLAREIPPVIDCRPMAAGDGRELFRRHLLADVFDNLSASSGNRDPDGSHKKADRCGDDSIPGKALDAVIEPSNDPELSALRQAWMIATNMREGMKQSEVLAEIREIETTELCRECGDGESKLNDGLCLSCMGR